MAGHGGGAWKVAYADFVTAMMAFFMVMWITAQNQDVRKAVANHFNNPLGRYEIGGAFRPPRHQSQFEQSRPPVGCRCVRGCTTELTVAVSPETQPGRSVV